MTDNEEFYYSQEHEIRALLTGRKIVEASNGTLTLDNGTQVRVIPNEDDSSNDSGFWTLDHLAAFDSIITRVQFKNVDHVPALTGGQSQTMELFVYSSKIPTKDKGKTKILSVSGDQGSGYYGAGYKLKVIVAD